MKTVIQSICILFIFVGCNEQTNDPSSLPPYQRWRSNNIHNYTIEQIRSCFCVSGGERMKITVRADTIFSVIKLSDSAIITPPISKLYLTIDSLFGIIRYSKSDSLVFTYDSKYGFPNMVDINPQFHAVDGGVLYETNNLQPLQ